MHHIKFLISVVFVCLCLTNLNAEKKQTVCLNMIVKNESPVIERCLASVKPIITSWVIVDTGSTDGTQHIIKNFMKDMPGQLYERPWVNFAYNRNEALDLAKNKADYILFIDADEKLVFDKDFILPNLDKDFYYIKTHFGGTEYDRVQLIKAALNWKWFGVVHEAVDSSEAKTNEALTGVFNQVSTEGNRSTDPQKYQKDAKLLEQAVLDEPNNSRNVFYLAQSYRDAKMYEPAIESYKKRIAMGGWEEELFWSKLQVAILQEALNEKPDMVVNSYYDAYLYRPNRIEPLYYLALYHRQKNNFLAGYHAARQGLNSKENNDLLFVEKYIYDYGLLLEFSINAYWAEKYTEALLASNLLLTDPTLPVNVKECVERNLFWIKEKINQPKEFLVNSLSILDTKSHKKAEAAVN